MVCCEIEAQTQGKVYEPNNANVVAQGKNLSAPWCGGLNSTQMAQADLNQDGKLDLVHYDYNNQLLRTFINTGTPNNPFYTYAPKYAANFPTINQYVLLEDYNCDGIKDLFHRGTFGVAVYKGYYQGGELKFTFFKDLFFPGQNGPVNVYVQPSDVPSIVDVDQDGDLDVLAFNVLGTQLVYYQNKRVEDVLPCDSMRMALGSNCWGGFFQAVRREVNLGIVCKGGEGDLNETEQGEKKYRHSGNCHVHLDLDGDNDIDMLDGNISYNDVQALYSDGFGNIISQDTLYQSGPTGHKAWMPTWPVPAYFDYDGDGVKDLLFSSHVDNASSANYHCVSYYKNTNTNANPNFLYQHDSLITDNMIDVGSYSYPTLFDFDKDGKLDLFVGSEGYYNNVNGNRISRLAYYKNTSTSGSISFELVNRDFLNMSQFNFDGIFPTFGDVTGDGIADLVFGGRPGKLGVYRNTAASNTAIPNFVFMIDSLPGANVGPYSTPLVYDFDADGKTDILCGNQNGHLVYIRDTSSSATKKFALLTITLGNIKAGNINELFGFSAPTVAKMDNTQEEFLVIGNIDGTIEKYDSFQNNLGTFNRLDSFYSFIQTPKRSAPAIADLDGDGKYDMIIGNKLGGLYLYKQVLSVGSSIYDYERLSQAIEVYPNPSSDFFNVHSTDKEIEIKSITIRDLHGRLQYTRQENTKRVDISPFSTGLYLLYIETDKGTVVKKVIKK